jgi:hypothetical protein
MAGEVVENQELRGRVFILFRTATWMLFASCSALSKAYVGKRSFTAARVASSAYCSAASLPSAIPKTSE